MSEHTQPAPTMAEQVVIEWLQAQADAIRVANPHLNRVEIEAASKGAWCISAKLSTGWAVGTGKTLTEAVADVLKSAKPPLIRAAELRAEAARLEQEAAT